MKLFDNNTGARLKIINTFLSFTSAFYCLLSMPYCLPTNFAPSPRTSPSLHLASRQTRGGYTFVCAQQIQGPNSLIFSFSSGPLDTMRAGRYCVLIHSQQIFLITRKTSTNIMPGGSALVICHCRRVLLDTVQ